MKKKVKQTPNAFLTYLKNQVGMVKVISGAPYKFNIDSGGLKKTLDVTENQYRLLTALVLSSTSTSAKISRFATACFGCCGSYLLNGQTDFVNLLSMSKEVSDKTVKETADYLTEMLIGEEVTIIDTVADILV